MAPKNDKSRACAWCWRHRGECPVLFFCWPITQQKPPDLFQTLSTCAPTPPTPWRPTALLCRRTSDTQRNAHSATRRDSHSATPRDVPTLLCRSPPDLHPSPAPSTPPRRPPLPNRAPDAHPSATSARSPSTPVPEAPVRRFPEHRIGEARTWNRASIKVEKAALTPAKLAEEDCTTPRLK
ncbi:hypothetical protein PVAP13_7NG107156 [Panicum virgatum]|uniref:Uncharacterized protein n=1 Tax=Panicum virgatum TaxID=38727 RepID=A0A8T0PUW5_PANVG|nr:hypothetical protein PVAP13_7NG107156 [Panicum virgatum]